MKIQTVLCCSECGTEISARVQSPHNLDTVLGNDLRIEVEPCEACEERGICEACEEKRAAICYSCTGITVGQAERDKAESRAVTIREIRDALLLPGNQADWKRANLQEGIDASDAEQITEALWNFVGGREPKEE